jgi:hypothetical protein
MRILKITAFLSVFVAGLLVLTGCEEKAAEKPKESATSYTQVAPMASKQALATQEKIVKVEAQKRIELEKISAQTRLKQLELEKERELALLREKERLLRIEHEQAKERYLIWAGIALMILVGLALLWYFDRRRQDKLIAYRDNLQKYFLFKENETRMKIAEKIVDTVAKQEISAEEKAKLIEVLHSPVAEGKPQLPAEPEDRSSPVEEQNEGPEDLEEGRKEETVIDVEEEPEKPVSESEEKKRPWYRLWGKGSGEEPTEK